MNQAVDFLKKCGVFYLATVDGDQARVRPFGAVMEYNGKIYLCTNNTKDCFKQMMQYPKVEISGMTDGKWVRLRGDVQQDTSKEAKTAMLDASPGLKDMYSADDDIFEVFFLKDPQAIIYSFADEPEWLEV